MNCLPTRGSPRDRDRAVQSPSLACEVRVGGPLPSQVLKTQGACHRRQTGCRAASPAHLRRFRSAAGCASFWLGSSLQRLSVSSLAPAFCCSWIPRRKLSLIPAPATPHVPTAIPHEQISGPTSPATIYGSTLSRNNRP